jgi:hypothetical protein
MEAKLEAMVLQTVCAGSDGRDCSRGGRPSGDARPHGCVACTVLRFGVGPSGGKPHMTKTVELICQMAEDSFQPPTLREAG